MKAKADPVVHGLLSEEQRRSREILQALQAKADKLPKGALNARRKQVQGKEYFYRRELIRHLQGRGMVKKNLV